jgi:hypothetical protein
MLEAALRIELAVPRQMHLAVFAGDPAAAVDQDRGVVAMAVRSEFSIAERDADLVKRCALEQRPGRGVRHLALEPGIHLGRIGHVPARKKRGQRQLGEHHEVAALRLRLIEQIDHPPDHRLAAVGPLDRAALGRGHPQHPAHRCPIRIGIAAGPELVFRTSKTVADLVTDFNGFREVRTSSDRRHGRT